MIAYVAAGLPRATNPSRVTTFTLAAIPPMLAEGVTCHFYVLWRFFRTMRRLSATLVFVVLGCGTPADSGSPNYQAGFGDGCASGAAESSAIPRPPRRNEALYARDPAYRSGWISGRASCRMMSGPPRL